MTLTVLSLHCQPLVSSEGSCDLLFKYLSASHFRCVPCFIYCDSPGFQDIFESIFQYILYLTYWSVPVFKISL